VFFKVAGEGREKESKSNTEMLYKVQNNFVALASGLLFCAVMLENTFPSRVAVC